MKILYVVNNLRSCNGVTTVLMSQYDAIIEKGHNVDFLQIAQRESIYVDKIRANGGSVFTMPTVKRKIDKATFRFLDDFFSRATYDIVHINISDLYAVLILRAAKKHNIRIIIYHSHNPKLIDSRKIMIKSFIYDSLCVYYANHYVACSISAGKSIFGTRNFTVLHNALDSSRYQFDMEERMNIRKQLGISDTDIVIGTIGRYAKQKNPIFAVDVFNQLSKQNGNIKYIWVGSGGVYENEIRERTRNNDNFYMVGSQDDANKWYSAFDIFLLPSIFEGFGNVLIEAQASGLPTVTSDVVPKETCVTDLIYYIGLSEGTCAWAEKIETIIDIGFNKRRSRTAEIVESGYDSVSNSHEFVDYYSQFED